jgi:hypothetical protein
MVNEILSIANPVICKPALPNLGSSSANGAERIGVPALDRLDGALDGCILSGSEQEMNMIGRQNEGVHKITTFAAVVK